MSNRWKGGFIQAFFDPLSPGEPTFNYDLYVWNNTINNFGQWGIDDPLNLQRSSPTQVGDTRLWEQVETANQNSYFRQSNGTIWGAGRNLHGSLGQGNVGINYSSPTQIGALTTWLTLSNPSYNAGNSGAALKTDGSLWVWGRNNTGQLGQNDIINRSSPVQVGALYTWLQVTSGYAMAAVKTDGTLWTWGQNSNGQLGQNDIINRSSPVQLGALTTWASVKFGNTNTFALKTDGTLWSFGLNNYGQLGHNDRINRSSPVQVGALTNWSFIGGGGSGFIHAIKTDGTLWGWGQNEEPGFGYRGAIGDGTILQRSSPVQIGSLTNWSSVSGGTYCAGATKTDGTLWWWGWNDQTPSFGYSQAPLNSPDQDYSSPVQVGSETDWDSVSIGKYGGFAVTKTPN